MTEELAKAISAARITAQRVGPMHSAWDDIFDAEAILAGKNTLNVWGSRDAAITALTRRLKRYG